jgi:iron complex transport system substrate-binding protein
VRNGLYFLMAGLAILGAIVAASGCSRAGPEGVPARGSGAPQRIVSLSPSITETLFALGLGDRVIGVTRHCRYPREAQSRTIVGSHFDMSFEAIVALEPDLVILRGENQQAASFLQQQGVSVLEVDHRSVEGVLDSLAVIGRRCGAEVKAAALGAAIRTEMDQVARKTAGLARPRVLVVAQRTLGSGKVEDVYVAGSDSFFDRLISLAGGQNACPRGRPGFPVVSAEGILSMNPQVIVDLIAKERQAGLAKETILRDWRHLDEVDAVRTGRVHLVDDDYVFIPGPRLGLTVRKFARLIHPELEWPP